VVAVPLRAAPPPLGRQPECSREWTAVDVARSAADVPAGTAVETVAAVKVESLLHITATAPLYTAATTRRSLHCSEAP